MRKLTSSQSSPEMPSSSGLYSRLEYYALMLSSSSTTSSVLSFLCLGDEVYEVVDRFDMMVVMLTVEWKEEPFSGLCLYEVNVTG